MKVEVRRHWHSLRQSSFSRGLGILVSASILQNVITFGSAPILSRLYTPEHFGVAGLLQALAVVPLLLANGQYYMAIGITRTQSESINVVFLSICLTTIGALVVLPLALLLQAHPNFLPASIAAVTPYAWTIPAFILAANFLAFTRLWEIRHAHYGSMMTSRLLESGALAVAQISFGLLGAGPLGLIIGRWLGIAMAAVHGLKQVLGQIGRRGLRSITLRRQRALARRHWRFPAYQLPATVLSGFTQQLTPLLLGIFYALQAVGFYWFASRLLDRPAIVIGDNVARVFFQHAADRQRQGRAVFGLFALSTGGLAGIGIVLFGLVIIFGPELFAWIFGSAWEMAGHYARWIAVANCAYLISFPARSATALFGLQQAFAVIETGRAVASALALLLIAAAGGGELLAVTVAAAAQSTITLVFVAYVGVRLAELDRARRRTQAEPSVI